MHYTGMAAMRLGGQLDYEPMRVAASVLIAISAATVALWLVTTLGGLGSTVVAAIVMGAAVSGAHYTAMAAVRIRLGEPHDPIAGVNPMLLLVPVVLLGGASIAMLAFFTFGASTVRDLKLIYEGQGEMSEPIEPWMIEEVLARTSRPMTVLPSAPHGTPPASHRARHSRIDRSMRSNVLWGGTPVWGAPGRRPRPAAPPTTQNAVAVTPARYPPNDPGWDCPGVISARSPEYRGGRRS
jgi:hypothetical protein